MQLQQDDYLSSQADHGEKQYLDRHDTMPYNHKVKTRLKITKEQIHAEFLDDEFSIIDSVEPAASCQQQGHASLCYAWFERLIHLFWFFLMLYVAFNFFRPLF
ncbi:uncharacterized protein B0P05DRAFT_590165 [Gilbertella persicaria]|uniref:Uncharacterized protein n=1 Tax=Rhizopus stolonifer TaxID=4846 RepID=A0A367IXT8_RHIST|nr:uncharacterized protein B0P05DRAFT_590165 [Gilbertella persicaria]KAI8064341.1 hypothetical protein B0P05DRAFT_590165 [Gilbertella persicaria]RCH82494.1 hypothetical protein CU098_005797 [Rhizopus stolonifer]